MPDADTTYGILASDVEYYFCKVHGETMFISDAIKVRYILRLHQKRGTSYALGSCLKIALLAGLAPARSGSGSGSPSLSPLRQVR